MLRSRFRLPEMSKLSRYGCSAANLEDRAEPSWHPGIVVMLQVRQSIRATSSSYCSLPQTPPEANAMQSRHTGYASYSFMTKPAALATTQVDGFGAEAPVEKLNWQCIKQMFAIVI